MRIVVASSNIFRRELTSYVIGEAGYEVAEAWDLDSLLALLSTGESAALILDVQLMGGEPAAALGAVRTRTTEPILWIAEASLGRDIVGRDERPADVLTWPYTADDLCERLTLLLGRATTTSPPQAPRARSVGSAE